MSFRYPCFISYAQGTGDLLVKFSEKLQQVLKATLEPYFDQGPWVDRTMLQTGAQLDQALAQAICESVCTIVVFVPKYKNSDWCMRELATALRIERERLAAHAGLFGGGDRFVLPVVFRGKDDDLPAPLRDRLWADFRGVSLYNIDFATDATYVTPLEKLAAHVWDMFSRMDAFSKAKQVPWCVDCPGCVLDPPFNAAGAAQPFPFR